MTLRMLYAAVYVPWITQRLHENREKPENEVFLCALCENLCGLCVEINPLTQSPQRDAKSIRVALSERSFSSVGNLDPLRIR